MISTVIHGDDLSRAGVAHAGWVGQLSSGSPLLSGLVHSETASETQRVVSADEFLGQGRAGCGQLTPKSCIGSTRDVRGRAQSPGNTVKPQLDTYFVIKSECAGGLFGEIWSGCIVPELLLELGDT